MKAYAIAGLLLAAFMMPRSAFAQVPVPTPTPDPLVYNDPAMHYAAPAGAHLVGQIQTPTLATLSQDPTPIAAWIVGSGQQMKVISIVMEAFNGDLDGFDSTYENALRSDDPATLVKNKEHVLLQNGMPALFLEVTQGSGFSTRKIFAYIWIDSQRAVVLSATSRLGVLDETSAKLLLAGATAVRYPSNQP